jgi:NADH-quinone oxidoreductase subunit H
VFVLAPMILIVTALGSFAVVVFGPGIAIADFNIGLLFFLAMSALGVYSIALAGWSSNNKYSLLGGLRAAAQMVSYESFMGLALMGVVIQASSFSIGDIIRSQGRLWYVVPQFAGFVVFVIAALAEMRRLPFDLPEAENELVAGYHSEYSGMKFALFFFGEYIGITLISSIIVVLFFGGYHGPGAESFAALGVLWYLLKTAAFVAFFILVRGSLPRPRYDQLMALAWKVLLPVSLANLLVTGACVLATRK